MFKRLIIRIGTEKEEEKNVIVKRKRRRVKVLKIKTCGFFSSAGYAWKRNPGVKYVCGGKGREKWRQFACNAKINVIQSHLVFLSFVGSI